ncbi:NrdD anaerobic NTP reductase large subunit [Aeromonas phage phiAS5]|uniref:NrdD anaerobic NTP reductase large subunit n=1 Tax=Aeromonas phage phiAS5 TaxID=879630 RepID=E1A2R4_9CAUD|nr:NrdD-like anaerobic ribonucleotide reductase large subunit [Aeromonas phage phiAS5]ADM80010.1 NrdD anaerobic NTP reductase large subunit [Aeromonas phage phiAS5]
MQVQKRDGRVVNFDQSFIETAISNSLKSINITDPTFPHHATEAVVRKLIGRNTVTIEEIQRVVEDTLMRSRYPAVARAYIEYRYDRDVARDMNSDMTKRIVGLMKQEDEGIMNENANKDAKVIPTQRDLVAGIVSKHFAKHYLPTEVLQAHEAGFIHFHDLDYSPFFPMFNCMLIDLNGMLERGFRMGNAQIETPKSIATAAAVTAQIIAQVASHIYGGNTINRIDEALAPYVKMTHEKHLDEARYWKIPDQRQYAIEKTRKAVYDAMQSLEYEVNTLHSANGQTPFCTFGFGLGTSWESELIQEAILKVRMKGLGKEGITPVFPKLVFALKDGHNLKPTDPLYRIKQMALECAAKRMYPDILSYDKVVEVTGSFKFPMGCRSFLHRWEDETGNEVHEGRNNLGVVTLNLPRIALDANGNQMRFFEILEERMEIVKKALLTRVDRLRGVKASVAPILYVEGACGVRLKPNDDIMKAFENGRASVSIGYIGLHEVSEIIKFNDESHVMENAEKQAFLLDVLSRMKEMANAWKAETGLAFSLYGTPSESLCYRFAKIDHALYEHKVFDKDYYTNSFHLSVDMNTNPYDKIDFEKQFIPLSTGGFISYGEYPNMKHNLEALEAVWDYAYRNTPYYGTNTPVDVCFECGFNGEFTATSKGYECPKCGNHDDRKMNVIRRVCGYLGNPGSRAFNVGKQDEVQRRVKHM